MRNGQPGLSSMRTTMTYHQRSLRWCTGRLKKLRSSRIVSKSYYLLNVSVFVKLELQRSIFHLILNNIMRTFICDVNYGYNEWAK